MAKKHFNLGLGQQIIHIGRVWVFYKNHWNFVKSAFDAFMYFNYWFSDFHIKLRNLMIVVLKFLSSL